MYCLGRKWPDQLRTDVCVNKIKNIIPHIFGYFEVWLIKKYQSYTIYSKRQKGARFFFITFTTVFITHRKSFNIFLVIFLKLYREIMPFIMLTIVHEKTTCNTFLI